MLQNNRVSFNQCKTKCSTNYLSAIDRERQARGGNNASGCPNISVVTGNTSLNNSYNVTGLDEVNLFLPKQSSSYELDITDEFVDPFVINNIYFGQATGAGVTSTGFGACNNFLYTLRINNTTLDSYDFSFNLTHVDGKPTWLFAESGPLAITVPTGDYVMILVKAELRGGIPHHTIMTVTQYTV